MNRLSVARRIVKTACPVLGAIAALTVMVNWVAGITWASGATTGNSITDTDLSPGQSSSSVSTAGEYPDNLDIVARVNGRNMSGRELDAFRCKATTSIWRSHSRTLARVSGLRAGWFQNTVA